MEEQAPTMPPKERAHRLTKLPNGNELFEGAPLPKLAAYFKEQLHGEAVPGHWKQTWTKEELEVVRKDLRPESLDPTAAADQLSNLPGADAQLWEEARRAARVFLFGLERFSIDLETWAISAELARGWDKELTRAERVRILLETGSNPLGLLRVLSTDRPKALQALKNLPLQLERGKIPVRAFKKNAQGDLFNPTEERVRELNNISSREASKLEEALATEAIETGGIVRVGAYWQMTPDEIALQEFLEEQFEQQGYTPPSLSFTPGEIITALEWETNTDTHQRLEEAVFRISTTFRPRGYPYLADKKKNTRRSKTSLSPLWAVEKEHAKGDKKLRVVRITFTPGPGLWHQVNPAHGGQPAFYIQEQRGIFQHLQQRYKGDTRATAECRQLLRLIKNDLPLKGGGEVVLTFSVEDLQKVWTFPAAVPKVAPIRGEQEARLRPLIEELLTSADKEAREVKDRDLAAALDITPDEAKRLRRRAGFVLRAKRKTQRKSELRRKVAKHLETLQSTHPETVLGFEVPGKGLAFRVRCKVPE